MVRKLYFRSVTALIAALILSSSAYGQLLFSKMKDREGGREQLLLSHNDYEQDVPFWNAYAQGIDIIEADLRMRGKTIVVAHDREQATSALTLKELYIDPLVGLGAKADGLMIMFDLKEPQVMKPLIKLLGKYPGTFRKGGVEVIISGERPSAGSFAGYPDYVWFDGDLGMEYTAEALAKIWMFSADIADHTNWNGKGSIAVAHKAAIMEKITVAHALGRKVRFWNTTENVNTWITLHNMGVDVIGTGQPAVCADFFSDFGRKNYTLEKPQPVYHPTYASDGKDGNAKNVIVIIGDGMGFAHLIAAETANRGQLSTLGIKNIGFQRNPSLDSYNTCSSAAATALFTGEKTDNNLLSMRPDRTPITNTAEIFVPNGIRVGVISTGDITDATPAANYAHAWDRNDSELIAGQLPSSGISLLVGPNRRPFHKRSDSRDIFEEMRARGYAVTHSADSIALLGEKVICIDDDRFGDYFDASQTGVLAPVMRDAIKQLDNPDGFFLMFESARIDYAAHVKNLPPVIIETIALDGAIAEALRFADEDGQTLVIVTGDHETGGLALIDGDRRRGYVAGYFVSDDHTGMAVPVYAYGVGAQHFRGFYENTDIIKKIMSLYGLPRMALTTDQDEK